MTIFLLATDSKIAKAFRGDLAKQMAELGHTVYVVASDLENEQYFNSINVKMLKVNYDRTTTNPFKDIGLTRQYIKLFKQYKPDLIYCYTIKPVIYGCLAARFCKIKKTYPLIPGVGVVFSGQGYKSKIIEKIVSKLYKISLKKTDKVFFQNRDDIDIFVNKHILPREHCVHVNGSGVNMQLFPHSPSPLPVSFMMATRLLKSKGVMEYCECAKRINENYGNIKCRLIGSTDSNPDSLQLSDIQPYIDCGAVDYVGFSNDIPSYLHNSTVFVLPTYYNEGLPRSILESMSVGRAVITTAWKGGKDAVIDKETGLLIPIKDTEALYNAMEYMVKNPDTAVKMGKKAYQRCCDVYDVNKVNDFILKTMGLL